MLALYQPREHYHLSVGKFQRIMICCRLIVGCQTILGSPPRATQAGGGGDAHSRAQPAIAVSTSFTQYDVPIGIASSLKS